MKTRNFGDSQSTISPLHDPLASPAPDAKNEVRNTTCYMCACRCGIRVHLRNGEVRYIDGNPDHPLNNGVICAKGSSGIMKQYSPARLDQAAAAQSRERIAVRENSRRSAGKRLSPSLQNGWEICAPPTRKNSRCSQDATRCRR